MIRLPRVSAACKVVALLCAVFYLGALAVLDPETSPVFWVCPIHALTGFKCAGCGGQRAVHALFQGDVLRALDENFLFVALAPLYALVGLVGNLTARTCYWMGWVVLLVGFMVVRNVWPGISFAAFR